MEKIRQDSSASMGPRLVPFNWVSPRQAPPLRHLMSQVLIWTSPQPKPPDLIQTMQSNRLKTHLARAPWWALTLSSTPSTYASFLISLLALIFFPTSFFLPYFCPLFTNHHLLISLPSSLPLYFVHYHDSIALTLSYLTSSLLSSLRPQWLLFPFLLSSLSLIHSQQQSSSPLSSPTSFFLSP